MYLTYIKHNKWAIVDEKLKIYGRLWMNEIKIYIRNGDCER